MSRASKILTAKRDGLRCSRLFLGLALLVLSGIFTPAEAQFSNGYSYRVEADFVDAEVIGGSHTNFPVLISSTLLDLRTVGNGGKVENANGFSECSHVEPNLRRGTDASDVPLRRASLPKLPKNWGLSNNVNPVTSSAGSAFPSDM